MTHYASPSLTASAVLALIQPYSSLRPISQGDILAQGRHIAPFDEIHEALEQLIDARLITQMRHTRNGVMQNVYWPTDLKPITAPTLEEIRMASEPKNSHLARLILKHGPISGADLAAKAQSAGLNCPTKNVQGILGGHITRGEIILKKRDGANWYMTATQAEEWCAATVQDAEPAHVMSGPKQSNAEIPVNETAPHDDQTATIRALQVDLAHRDRTIHDLKNDVAGANLVLHQLADKLQVNAFEQIPAAIDEIMHATTTRVLHADPLPGKQALVLIDSAELIEIEELAVDDDAQNMALASIELGHAARVLVVRIMGEAKRQAEWKAAV